MLPFDPTLYFIAAMLYAAQARAALKHQHPCTIYVGLAAVHFCMAVKKLLILG